MAITPKRLGPLDDAIASLLGRDVAVSGKSRRDLARDTGMSTNRIGIILRHEPPPATVGEVGLLAAAVGRTASAVIAEAEGPVSEGGETMGLAAASDSDIDAEVEAQQVEP